MQAGKKDEMDVNGKWKKVIMNEHRERDDNN